MFLGVSADSLKSVEERIGSGVAFESLKSFDTYIVDKI